MTDSVPAVTSEQCSWCGEAIDADDGFRAYEPEGERHAAFCRLEHVVPWVIRGAHWSADAGREQADSASGAETAAEGCAHCGGVVGDRCVVLVRRRGEYRIADRFCQVEHMLDWAKAGGRWQG